MYLIDRKIFKHVLIVVSDAFFVGYIYGKIFLKKNRGCLFNLLKNFKHVVLSFVCLSLMCNSLFKLFLVGIFLVINGILTILCFMSVMWNVCLKDLRKSLFCSIVRDGIRSKRHFS